MPRPPRYIQPRGIFHLISRFVDREWFIESDAERAVYLELLSRFIPRSDWSCFGYAIMSNHIHLECLAGVQSLDSWIRPVNSGFADWLNRTRSRIGSVFVRGPKSILVQPERAIRVLAYIHNNPVRAGVVERARDSAWTSHRFYVGLEKPPVWLDVETGLALAGISAGAGFDAFVADPTNQTPEIRGIDLPEESETVVPLVAELRAVAESIVAATAQELAIPVTQLCSQRRGRAEVLGRRVAVHCATIVGVTGANIASALCMSQQNASLLARREVGPDVAAVAGRVLPRLILPTRSA